jgi:hypothetical protein
MAAVWVAAITDARVANMLQEPEDTGISDDTSTSSCQKVPGHADGPHSTQKGYGFDDGPYRHASTRVEITGVAQPVDEHDSLTEWKFAQIVNLGGNPNPRGALDNLVRWSSVGSELRLQYWANQGGGKFADPKWTTLPFTCHSSDIRWADVGSKSKSKALPHELTCHR